MEIRNSFPPFALSCKDIDMEPDAELVFKEGFKEYDSTADNDLVICNPAEKDGYLNRHITNIRIPIMFNYPASPENNTGKAVLICPGGGYHLLAADKEGHDFARYFNHIGVSAFVLYYPMPNMNGIPGEFPYLPLRSAQRAMRLIRSQADLFGIDTDKIGVMGFSAGAHLASSVSTLWKDTDEKNSEFSGVSSKPDFSILIYPVITITSDKKHVGSALNLLGENASIVLQEKFSAELQVNAETPPAFLVQAEDDGVNIENSILYYLALRKAGVQGELHFYPEGGHGYGMIQRGMAIDTWPDRLRDWIKRI